MTGDAKIPSEWPLEIALGTGTIMGLMYFLFVRFIASERLLGIPLRLENTLCALKTLEVNLM
jgi:hypothetical protein